MRIEIKNMSVLKVLLSKNYHPVLVEILLDLSSTVTELTVTEGWRPGKGVHSTDPCRGLDLRSWIYTSTKLTEIATYINARWQYDYKRPEKICCYIHNSGQGEHIHLQVHPNTRRRH